MDRGRELSSWSSAHPGISNGLNYREDLLRLRPAHEIFCRGTRAVPSCSDMHQLTAMVGQYHRCHDEIEGGSVQRFGSTQWILLRHQNDKVPHGMACLVRVDGAGWTHRHI
jgi:hypothetical protein